jgi:hypothetical protein
MKRPRAHLKALLPPLVLIPAFLIQACSAMGAWDILRARDQVDEQLGSNRIKLVFDNSGQNENLDNFPVLVVLNADRTGDYQGFAHGGTDLRFLDPAEPARLLDYEIELWDPEGESFIWVKVPRIDAASGSDFIWMYFHNPELEESGENPQGVWSDYGLVYHLSPHPQAEIFDSGPGAHHGEALEEAMPDLVPAQIGYGFPASDAPKRYIDTGYREDLERWTVEAWVKAAQAPNKQPGSGNTTGPVLGKQKYNLVWDHQGWNGAVHCLGQDGFDKLASFNALSGDQWYYLAGVYDSAARTLRAFKDGTMQTETQGVIDPLSPVDEDVFIGTWPGAALVLNGIIDEVRIQGKARSSDWIRAQHLSMTDAFITYGDIQELGE